MTTKARPYRADARRVADAHDREHDHEREQWAASGPFALMRQGIDEMDRWFSRLSRSSSSWLPATQRSGDWTPPVEVFQRAGEFVIRLEVPGMTRTDLHVEAGDDSITVHGERKQEHRQEGDGVFWSERSYGSFSRTIPLPTGTIADSAKATFSNGVLEIVMAAPSPEARRGRRIDISGT
jgi:HSP20 family protein